MKEPYKILVVDDDPGTLRLLEKRLKDAHGYNVLTAQDSKTGIHLAQTENPDLIVLDVMIPDMTGGEVAKILHSDPKTRDIPIIFLTVLLEQKGKKEIELDGVSYKAIAKPYYQPELLSLIKKSIKKKEHEQRESP